MSQSDLTFGERLRYIRDLRNLTQSDLARKAGLQPSTIAHFEAGRRAPSFTNIGRLAVALGCSSDALLGLPAASMKMLPQVTPYSSVVGGSIALLDEGGRAGFLLIVRGTSNGISKEQSDAVCRQINDLIVARGGLDVPAR